MNKDPAPLAVVSVQSQAVEGRGENSFAAPALEAPEQDHVLKPEQPKTSDESDV